MKTIEIYTEFITLGQFLKLSGIIRNGGEAKRFLAENIVTVNGEVDCRRGRKLYNNYEVVVKNQSYLIKSDVQA